jgi:replication factor C subunit 1
LDFETFCIETIDFQGPWEVIRKVFSAEEHKKMSMNDKSDLFFYDYSMAPLFVQENYLSVKPNVPK